MAGQRVEPHLFIIFGATGDLTRRKLLPALFRLASEGHTPERYAILGVGRKAELDSEIFRDQARTGLREAGFPEKEIDDWCAHRVHYYALEETTQDNLSGLSKHIEALEKKIGLPGNRVFYLAMPPSVFPATMEGMGEAGLGESAGWTRLVVEKPFGDSLSAAQKLNKLVHRNFDESQIYRIDHYLGKETVQNLLVFRFANSIFESLWNRDRVESVQITVAESLGIEMRAGYYEHAGALRDMVQNHLTQLVTLIAMEVPASFTADAVRYEKVKVLSAISSIDPDELVFGQYTGGVIHEEEVAGYTDEPGVDPRSQTETYVALKLELDTWRWQGVPFYIRTGKRMPRRLTQIAVTFRKPPVRLFESAGAFQTNPNILLLTLQPDEGFDLCVDVKVPGEPFQLRTLPLHFLYKEAFAPAPDAYQTLLLDVLTGDQTLFVHAEETEASWALYKPVLDTQLPIHAYAAGSWGPREADRLLARDGHIWIDPVDAGRAHDSASHQGLR